MTIGIIRKDLPLTVDRARELLKYDRTAGGLFWRVGGPGHRKGKRAGAVCGLYRQIMLDCVNYREHRIIWLMQTGSWPPALVDHRDGNGLNNAWDNLRQATYSQNAFNRRPGKRNTTGHVGVCPDKASGKFEAHITINGRIHHLGKFECVADAVAIRCEAEKHYFGGFARQAVRYSDATE
ncbi:MAG: HNH endonuclease [Hyphomicrobiales bacterium]|nr:HNH endonuclease [Hyphomicrobiales bacterium]MCP4998655.1 HNH endonuclease [Hyphomicrobiales bacterium]